MHNAKLRLKQV